MQQRFAINFAAFSMIFSFSCFNKFSKFSIIFFSSMTDVLGADGVENIFFNALSADKITDGFECEINCNKFGMMPDCIILYE